MLSIPIGHFRYRFRAGFVVLRLSVALVPFNRYISFFINTSISTNHHYAVYASIES